MALKIQKDHFRYSYSPVKQGRHKFYTLTMPSHVLAATTFVTTRFDDPKEGFQRLLDKKRAQSIADYIDEGMGTIPNSIVLSAQRDAELEIVSEGKSLQFKNTKKAFLILDGQHRVYGFSLAKTDLRVPVVIYNDLSRKDESRLFIDINTKQRPVPNELLLDIKNIADYESDQEKLLRQVYDAFHTNPDSPLLGLLSPAAISKGKITRVTFNASLKPIIISFGNRDAEDIYKILAAYLKAFIDRSSINDVPKLITNPIVFRAIMLLFRDIARLVQDKHNKVYTVENFNEELEPLFSSLNFNLLKNPKSRKDLYDELLKLLKTGFVL